jgi:hypothetical protein
MGKGSDIMNKAAALEILQNHNAWRRGAVKDMPNSPYEIGQAIDVAIETLDLTIKCGLGSDTIRRSKKSEREAV